MQLFRVVLEWTGPQIVGRAVTVLHYDGSNQTSPPVAAILSAFTPACNSMPTGVVLTVPNSGDIIEDTTGHLTGVWSGTGGGPKNATGVTNSPAGVGACIAWSTGGIVNGSKGPRKLRGRTFVVPLSGDSYDGSGTLSDNAKANVVATAAALRAAGPLAVWHRPTTVGGSDGGSYGVIGHNVRDKVAYLSSRRD